MREGIGSGIHMEVTFMSLDRNRSVRGMAVTMIAGWRGTPKRGWRVLARSSSGIVFETYLSGGENDWESVLRTAHNTWTAQIGWSRVTAAAPKRGETVVPPKKGTNGCRPQDMGRHVIGRVTETFAPSKATVRRVNEKAMLAYSSIPKCPVPSIVRA